MHIEEARLYLFVAIDGTSKFAFAQLHAKATAGIASDFLRAASRPCRPFLLANAHVDHVREFWAERRRKVIVAGSDQDQVGFLLNRVRSTIRRRRSP